MLMPRVAYPQSVGPSAINIGPEVLKQSPPGENWSSYNGDYSGRRYSGLSQINPENVSQLSAQWVFHSDNSDRLEVTPVVINGLMLVTSANDAYALDARSGREIWHHSVPKNEGLIDDAAGHHTRGVAIWHSRVYMNTDNAHLLCLDLRSGHLVWDVPYADWNKNYGATSAPLAVNGKILVGTSGGDDGVRG
ncbi:MAG: PQQ-dependent dehydrogenase, methanol/ethanol family, partial [Acidobacteria bacterium]